MKATLMYLIALLAPLSAMATGNTHDTIGDGVYPVDIHSSEITWKGYKLLGQHHGTIEMKYGTLEFDNGVLVGGEFTIDMTTIRNGDMAGTASAAKLEGHLKSDDFFGVERFPEALFKIKSAIPFGTVGDYKIAGEITIKGITKPVNFMAHIDETDAGLAATAKITIDRSQFDVRYGSNSFFDNLGDKAINDNFDLEVSLQLNTVQP